MKIEISAGAEADVADGYWFYERQSIGLGDYFRSCIFVDIESLRYFGGIHEIEYGFHRSLSKRFPFGLYYTVANDCVTVVAVLDLRREPLFASNIGSRIDSTVRLAGSPSNHRTDTTLQRGINAHFQGNGRTSSRNRDETRYEFRKHSRTLSPHRIFTPKFGRSLIVTLVLLVRSYRSARGISCDS